jgi:hypothetical protein
MDLRAVRGLGFFGFFDFGDFLEFVEGLEGKLFFELNMVFVGGFAIGGFFEEGLKVLGFECKVFDFLFFGHEESFGQIWVFLFEHFLIMGRESGDIVNNTKLVGGVGLFL